MHGDCALYCLYPNLFKIVANPTIIVSDAFSNYSISLQFNRQLTGSALSEWHDMQISVPFHRIPNTLIISHGDGHLQEFLLFIPYTHGWNLGGFKYPIYNNLEV